MKKRKRWLAAAVSFLLSCSALPFPSASAVGGQSNEEMIFSFLKEDMQLNDAVAAGILANIYQESGFNPAASCVDTNGLVSYGLCQWNGVRFSSLKYFCEANGYAYDSLTGQLAFLQNDLLTTYAPYYYGTLLGAFENSPDGAADAAYSWAASYEVCNSAYFSWRSSLARDVFYPAYAGYVAPDAPISDLDTGFYATLHFDGFYLETDENHQVKFSDQETKTAQPPEYWYLERQEDGSYLLYQQDKSRVLSGEYGVLTMEEPAGQTWFLYQTDGGFVMKSAQTEWTVGADLGLYDMPLTVAPAIGLDRIYAPRMAAISVLPSIYPTYTTIGWNQDASTESCTLSIWNGKEASGTPARTITNISGNNVTLPLRAGTYTAVLQQKNLGGVTETAPLTFSVSEQPHADLGEQQAFTIAYDTKDIVLTPENVHEVTFAEKRGISEQIWSFQKTAAGGYRVVDMVSGLALTADAKNALSLQAVDYKKTENQTWYLYETDKEDSYQLCIHDKLLSLDADGKPVLRISNKEEYQNVTLLPYQMPTPELSVTTYGEDLPSMFRWNAIEEADTYLLDIQTEDGTPVLQIETDKTEHNLTLEIGRYKAAITAKNSSISMETTSKPISFTITSAVRPLIDVTADAEGMTTITWNQEQCPVLEDVKILDAQTGEAVYTANAAWCTERKLALPQGKYQITGMYNGTESVETVFAVEGETVAIQETLAEKVLRSRYDVQDELPE